MSARLWSVRRACWELAKLVLTRRGSWPLYVVVDDLSADAATEFGTTNWRFYHLDWIGGEDGFATLCAEPEGELPTARPAADGRIAELTEQAAADRARIADLEKQLTKEKLLTTTQNSEVMRLVKQNNVINLRADAAIAEAARLRADAEYHAARPCECGGKPEEHWRQRAAAAEAQAEQDRANAIRLTDECERLRLRADEADRLVHIAEQLERAR